MPYFASAVGRGSWVISGSFLHRVQHAHMHALRASTWRCRHLLLMHGLQLQGCLGPLQQRCQTPRGLFVLRNKCTPVRCCPSLRITINEISISIRASPQFSICSYKRVKGRSHTVENRVRLFDCPVLQLALPPGKTEVEIVASGSFRLAATQASSLCREEWLQYHR